MAKNSVKNVIVGVCGIMMVGLTAVAANGVSAVGTYLENQSVSLYVKGIQGEVISAEAQIGTATGQQVRYEPVKDMEQVSRTLIMIDNSLSITEKNREKVYDFLMEYVDDKPEKEEVTITTFSENISSVADYTADDKELEAAIEAITYEDQETYLTDVLYEAIEQEYLGSDDCFKKIIIISDGVDSKAIGYTKDELYALIKEKAYPIYTLGCMYKGNNEQLENMFALARMTSGKDFLLDEIEDTDDVVDAIMEDNQIVHFMIEPDTELLDGSIKSIRLIVHTETAEQTLETDLKMPFMEEKEEEQEITVETETEAETEAMAEPEEQEKPKPDKSFLPFVVLAGVIALVVLGLILVFILIIRKSSVKEKNSFEVLPENVHLDVEHEVTEEERTVMLNEYNKDEESTQMIWNNAVKQYNLILIDVKNPVRSFQMAIRGSVVIGRKAGEADIVIDYDKSVSGRHCQISERNGKFFVKDLQSSNGTLLNGVRILAEMEIYSGCILTLGRLKMKVEIR